MSLLRSATTTKVFHHISKRPQAVSLSTTTNHQNNPKPPNLPTTKRPTTRPSFKTKRSTPPSRQSRKIFIVPKHPHNDIDLAVFGINPPASTYRELEFDHSRQVKHAPARCGSATRPYIGVSSTLRTRRLMTPATPTTPISAVRAMLSEDMQSKIRPLPMVGVSSVRMARVTTPMMNAVRTMASSAMASRGCGVVSAPKVNRVATSSAPMAMTASVAGPSTSAGPCYVQQRGFKKLIDCTEKILKGRKPCFAVKKLRPKKPPIDWTSPCACDYQKKNLDRCVKWKCRPSFRKCPPPKNFGKVYKCPKRVKKPRMKRIAVKERKIRLGYKVCRKPTNIQKPFECFPKPPPPPPPPEPTPKRCPCFKPQELPRPPPCKKIRCAVDSNCKRKPRKLDASCPCKKEF